MNEVEHLLCVTQEECNEIIEAACRLAQRASKALRFGLEEVQPGQEATNAQRVVIEFYDLTATIEVLIEQGKLPRMNLHELLAVKRRKIEQFLAYSRQRGTLTEESEVKR